MPKKAPGKLKTPGKFAFGRFYRASAGFSLLLALLLAGALPLVTRGGGAHGAEFEIKPSIGISEEYNDNVFLTNENRLDDYITRTTPSVALRYGAPLWKWDLAYTFDYLYYAKRTRKDDKIHNLNAVGTIELLKEKLFLKISDDYNRVSLDITRDLTKESPFLNLSDRNLFVLNPYAVRRLSPRMSVTAGYLYLNTWYKERSGVGKTSNIFYAEPAYELSPKAVLNAGYRYTRESSDAGDFGKNDLYAGSKWEYAEGSNFFFRVGNSWLKYKGRKGGSNVFWNAGVTHNFAAFTGSLETSLDYTENPLGTVDKTTTYLAGVKKEFKRTLVNLSVALAEFKDAATNRYQTEKYGVNTSARYEISPKTTGFLDFTVERLEDKVVRTYTRRYILGLRLDYLLWKDATLDLAYGYTESHSPKIVSEKYRNNRFFAGVKKSF